MSLVLVEETLKASLLAEIFDYCACSAVPYPY